MRAQQTHVTSTGYPAAELPDMPGVYFLGGDVYLTAWSLSKWAVDVLPLDARAPASVALSAKALTNGREVYEAFKRRSRRQPPVGAA